MRRCLLKLISVSVCVCECISNIVFFPLSLSTCSFFSERYFITCYAQVLGGSLLPLGVDADYTADSSGQADEAVVEADPVEGGEGDGQVADVGDELEAAGESFPEGGGFSTC